MSTAAVYGAPQNLSPQQRYLVVVDSALPPFIDPHVPLTMVCSFSWLTMLKPPNLSAGAGTSDGFGTLPGHAAPGVTLGAVAGNFPPLFHAIPQVLVLEDQDSSFRRVFPGY